MTASPPSHAGEGGPLVRTGDVVAGKFRIERVLGQGGMGVVVAARHLQLDEMVALKFLRAHAVSDRDALARFTREARAAAKLKSEHVGRVLDVGVAEDGAPYIVMEYLEGRNLGQVLEDAGCLDIPAVAEYAIQACEGLAEAHARGIVHRDIKPENLFLVERAQGWRMVKILDFGISKVSMVREPSDTSNLVTQSLLGSPCYMSPEQLRSTATVDHRTDIWSLGVTVFELLAGRTAYSAWQTLPQLVAAILEVPTPRLADVLPDIPVELSEVVERCMAKDRDARFASAAELALALLPFAPKRCRANVERAISVTQSSQSSSELGPTGPVNLSSPPPNAAAAGTLKSATLSKAAESNLDTLAAPTVTASQGRRGASRFAVGVAMVGAVGVLVWGATRLRSAPASEPARTTGAVAAPPLYGSVPDFTAPAAPEATPPPSASVVPEAAPTASAATAASARAVRRPAAAPARPAASSTAPGGAPSGAPASLDIRMQR